MVDRATGQEVDLCIRIGRFSRVASKLSNLILSIVRIESYGVAGEHAVLTADGYTSWELIIVQMHDLQRWSRDAESWAIC